MILKSLEDLERYKNSISTSRHLVSLKDINEVSEGGGESTNTCNNKLFYWNFESYYIEDLVRCYEKINTSNINTRTLHEFEIDLKYIAHEMISENICPIEAILYASKVINNKLLSNDLLVDTIGNIIAYIYSKNQVEYKETIKFILEEWSWTNQIMILINACGKIQDVDLLQVIYEHHTKGDNRLHALKAFMNGKEDICVDYTLKLISLTQELDNTEVQMSKYFIHNYIKNFGTSYIKKAEEYFNIPNINKQAQKIISRVIPTTSNTQAITLDVMIKKAKNWDTENDFEEVFDNWMDNTITRKNAFLAIRYSNSPIVEDLVINKLKKYKCNSIEIGTALITLAQWGSRRVCSQSFYELIEKYKYDISKKVYCNAAMCSLGKKEDAIELIKEFLEQNYYDSRQIFSIIRDCGYKSNQLLKSSVQAVYNEYLNSNNEEKIIKAINGAYELCDKPKFNFKDIVLSSIKESIGITTNIKKIYSEDVYLALINLVEKLLNDKNKDEFIDILFFIIENKKCNQRLKLKCISMLKRLRVDPPK